MRKKMKILRFESIEIFFLIFNVQPKFALPYNNYDNFFSDNL